MTYCVGMCLDEGLVLASDTRTNAGVDNVSTFRKMHIWSRPGDRLMVLLSAGNLAVSQSVVSVIDERFNTGAEEPDSLIGATSMFQAVRLVGDAVRQVRDRDAEALEAQAEGFNVSFLFAGQIRGGQARLFQVYAAGNFIEATEDTPYFQIGEHKYGKPILDRVVDLKLSLADAVKLVLLSFDSTMRSNMSVGPPIDILVYRRDSLAITFQQRLAADDPYLAAIRGQWSDALREAFQHMPDFPGMADV